MVHCTPFEHLRKLKPTHSIVLRFIFKPQDGKLWVYNKPKLDHSYFREIPHRSGIDALEVNHYEETKEKREKDEDEENDVDL